MVVANKKSVFSSIIIIALIFTGSISFAFLNGNISDKRPVSSVSPAPVESMISEQSPIPTLTLSPVPTPTLTPTSVPTNTPLPTPTPEPTATPEPTLSPKPKPTLEILAPASVKIRYGNTSKKEVAMTIDDGGKDMVNILEIVNNKGIKVTFFLIAGELDSRPALWRKAIADGHHVLNHSVSHKTDMAYRSDEFIINEITGWEKVTARVLGDEYLLRMKEEMPFFRPPGGSDSARMRQILGNLGYPVMPFWSVEDYHFQKTNTKNITLSDHYSRETENGSIYLLHPYNYRHLESIIDKVQAKGYEFKLLADIIDWDGKKK